MSSRLRCAILVSAAMLAGWASAQTSTTATLLALSKQDHTLAIIDPANLRVLARLPVGDDPHEVIASADGRTAYVSNYGFGAFHTLTVIDLAGQKPAGVIDLGALRGPHGLTFEQGKVWFTAEAAKAIGSYDPTTDRIDWIMGTGQNRTHMLCVFPGGKRILTTNVNSATVTILEKTEAALLVRRQECPQELVVLRLVPVVRPQCRRAGTGSSQSFPWAGERRVSMSRLTARKPGWLTPGTAPSR